MVAVYVFADIPEMSTDTETLSVSPVEFPLVGFNVSQSFGEDASSETDQFSVPDPSFQMVKVWLGGLEPPSTALKVKLAGL